MIDVDLIPEIDYFDCKDYTNFSDEELNADMLQSKGFGDAGYVSIHGLRLLLLDAREDTLMPEIDSVTAYSRQGAGQLRYVPIGFIDNETLLVIDTAGRIFKAPKKCEYDFRFMEKYKLKMNMVNREGSLLMFNGKVYGSGKEINNFGGLTAGWSGAVINDETSSEGLKALCGTLVSRHKVFDKVSYLNLKRAGNSKLMIYNCDILHLEGTNSLDIDVDNCRYVDLGILSKDSKVKLGRNIGRVRVVGMLMDSFDITVRCDLNKVIMTNFRGLSDFVIRIGSADALKLEASKKELLKHIGNGAYIVSSVEVRNYFNAWVRGKVGVSSMETLYSDRWRTS